MLTQNIGGLIMNAEDLKNLTVYLPYIYANRMIIIAFKPTYFQKFGKHGIAIEYYEFNNVNQNQLPQSYAEFINLLNSMQTRGTSLTFATFDALDRPFTQFLNDLASVISGEIQSIQFTIFLNKQLSFLNIEHNQQNLIIQIPAKNAIIPNQYMNITYDYMEIAQYIRNIILQNNFAFQLDTEYVNRSMMQQTSNTFARAVANNNPFSAQNNTQQANMFTNYNMQNNNNTRQMNTNKNIQQPTNTVAQDQVQYMIEEISNRVFEKIKGYIDTLMQNKSNEVKEQTLDAQAISEALEESGLTTEDLKELNV